VSIRWQDRGPRRAIRHGRDRFLLRACLAIVALGCGLGANVLPAEAAQLSCSGLRQACLTKCNQMRRMTADTCIGTCGGYHAACMKTGAWNGALSHFVAVKRQ
jgi:hypothetical protein